jgi:GT2 family glycosyltransferase
VAAPAGRALTIMAESGGRARVQGIVVNFNTGDVLLRCIRSVLGQGPDVALAVIDNASSDSSADAVADQFGQDSRITLLRNAANPGFACAVNQAARIMNEANADYLLILNPDCELQPGALDALLQALDGDPRADLAGPRVTDRAGQPQRATLRRFPDPWKSFVTFSGLWRLEGRWPLFRGVEWFGPLPDAVTPAEAVSGACMLVRAAAFREAGGMDEAYGLHGEDLDLMYRLRQRGGYSLYVPQARVVHLQGLSSRSRPLWVHWQKHRGMQRFFLKFQAPAYPGLLRWPISLLVLLGIWLRFVLMLPLALLRR